MSLKLKVMFPDGEREVQAAIEQLSYYNSVAGNWSNGSINIEPFPMLGWDFYRSSDGGWVAVESNDK